MAGKLSVTLICTVISLKDQPKRILTCGTKRSLIRIEDERKLLGKY